MNGFRTLILAGLAALLCTACASGGGAGASSLDMYGTLDTGLTFHSR